MNTLDFFNINKSLTQIDSQFESLKNKEFANCTEEVIVLSESGLSSILEQHSWLSECQLVFQENQLFIKQPNNVGILVSIYNLDYSYEIVEFLKTKNLSIENLTALKTSLIMFLTSLEQGVEMLEKRGLNLENGILAYGYNFNRSFNGRKLVPLPINLAI